MNTTNNSLVEGCSVENSDRDSFYENVLKELIEKDKKLEYDYKHPHFRGKEIKWIKGSIITENACDTTTPDIEEDNHNLICYDGKEYTKHRFLKAQFKDYMKYAYKVQFSSDNVFYLSSNQRAKLQYHILAQYYDLVEVDEQDKKDLEMFCAKQDNQTIQKWHDRMFWKDGHEKMITFGASLGVRSYKADSGTIYVEKVKPFCYRMKIDNDKAIYTGVSKTWEEWTQGMVSCIEFRRADILRRYGDSKTLQKNDRQCMMSMYYQNGIYLTLPSKESAILRKYLNEYIKHGNAVLEGLSGEIPNADIAFTIDFKNDVEIVKQHDNTKHNQEMGKDMVINTFSRLTGEEWTTQEIYSQGFNKGNIERFVKHGLIKRIKKGHYIRVAK